MSFFFFFQLVASFLVELETIVMVVVVWLCHGFYFCGCGLIFLGSCGLILVVVAVEELAVGSGSGGRLYEVVMAVVRCIILL